LFYRLRHPVDWSEGGSYRF